MDDFYSHFGRRGFGIAKACNHKALDMLRNQIFHKTREVFGETEDTNPESFFNHFHKLNITGAELNEKRMKLIQNCTNTVDSGTLIYDAFQDSIEGLLGPDLLVQKNTNLVIQQPGDPNPSELHRDAPANSPYEIVVWLPLNDSYGTKAMYMLDLEKTEKVLSMLDENDRDWAKFEEHCLSVSEQLDVPYGTALIFWTGLFHGSRINRESETRWTLNMRYKNLFSPNGMKEPFEFFKFFKASSLTKLGLRYQKREVFK